MKSKMIKLLEVNENISVKRLLKHTKVLTIKEKTDKLEYNKLKRWYSREWDKTVATYN